MGIIHFAEWFAAVALLGYGCIWATLSVLKAKYRDEIKNVTTCGYVAPAPSLSQTAGLLKFSRRLTNIQVGEITYKGRHNLDNLRGPRIISANHPHWADAAIMPQLIQAPCRYMAHGRVMSALGGLLGVYLSKKGVFAANDGIYDGGVRTRAAAVEMITNNENIVILPEGLTNFSPKMGPVKNGTVIIARTAAAKIGKPVSILPCYIRYGKYPGAWLSRFDRQTQFFMVLLAFPIFRRKAVVVVGEPISTDEFTVATATGERRPMTDDEASALLKQRIESLDPGSV
jgi:1-acyl-sn-glycerol-3-phosphate acyltransferase